MGPDLLLNSARSCCQKMLTNPVAKCYICLYIKIYTYICLSIYVCIYTYVCITLEKTDLNHLLLTTGPRHRVECNYIYIYVYLSMCVCIALQENKYESPVINHLGPNPFSTDKLESPVINHLGTHLLLVTWANCHLRLE